MMLCNTQTSCDLKRKRAFVALEAVHMLTPAIVLTACCAFRLDSFI